MDHFTSTKKADNRIIELSTLIELEDEHILQLVSDIESHKEKLNIKISIYESMQRKLDLRISSLQIFIENQEERLQSLQIFIKNQEERLQYEDNSMEMFRISSETSNTKNHMLKQQIEEFIADKCMFERQIEKSILDLSKLETNFLQLNVDKSKLEKRIIQLNADKCRLEKQIEINNSDKSKLETGIVKLEKKIRKEPVAKCRLFRLCREIIQCKFSLPIGFFNMKGDKCFCPCCETNTKSYYTRGSHPMRYAIPYGYVRIGLKINKGFADTHEVFSNWHISFHGTKVDNIREIFSSNLQLLKPGDYTISGKQLEIRSGHIKSRHERINLYTKNKEMFNTNQIFTSPSIIYASNRVYAEEDIVPHPFITGKRIRLNYIFQCRQRPSSYKIGQQTIGKSEQIDKLFNNNELEWYTPENVGIILTGLLIKIIEIID